MRRRGKMKSKILYKYEVLRRKELVVLLSGILLNQILPEIQEVIKRLKKQAKEKDKPIKKNKGKKGGS